MSIDNATTLPAAAREQHRTVSIIRLLLDFFFMTLTSFFMQATPRSKNPSSNGLFGTRRFGCNQHHCDLIGMIEEFIVHHDQF
jgi:hypothetical protein